MCLEDIRLGRKLASAPRTVTLTAATVVPIAGTSGNRTRLIVAGDGVNAVFLAPQGMTPGNGVGIPLTSSHPFAVLTIEDWGILVTGSWQAFCQAAAPTLTVIEGSLGQQ